ncbi:MAG: hypothetical protein CMJ70_06545 [Planctomycetaceae bacterium]|nr:hypothetical protein [Planctomycetaceae bacterium]HAA72447.1 hypothetical protein [Planctomycetaceae bacterium]
MNRPPLGSAKCDQETEKRAIPDRSRHRGDRKTIRNLPPQRQVAGHVQLPLLFFSEPAQYSSLYVGGVRLHQYKEPHMKYLLGPLLVLGMVRSGGSERLHRG